MRNDRPNTFAVLAGTILAVVVTMLAGGVASGQGEGVDPTFNAAPTLGSGLTPESGMAVPEPDGKMITLVRYPNTIGGTTSAVNRVNADGSIDSSFNCTSCTWSIYSIGRQPDGKVLIAGLNDMKNARILRLNADGSLDFTFISPYDQQPSFSSSAQIRAVAPDGKCLFGLGTDKPVPADYDGDGMADIAVFRPSDGNWYFLKTAEGYTGVHFGTSTDIPTQSAYIPPADENKVQSPGSKVRSPGSKVRGSR